MSGARPYVVSLKRQDSSSSWGFHLSGGSEYNHPLFVKKVLYNSLAERSGLQEGDQLVQVGKANVRNRTLDEAHELIFRSGNAVDMIVIREGKRDEAIRHPHFENDTEDRQDARYDNLLISPSRRHRPQESQSQQKLEQPSVKAIVHAQYNSPLNLYSAENIAETIGRTAELITEGPVSVVNIKGSESSYSKPSAVLQLVKEDDYYRERYHGGVPNGSPAYSHQASVSPSGPHTAQSYTAQVRTTSQAYSTGQQQQYSRQTSHKSAVTPSSFYPPTEVQQRTEVEFHTGPEYWAPEKQVSSIHIGTPQATATPSQKPEPPRRTTSVCHVQLQSPSQKPPSAPRMTPTSPPGSPSSYRRHRNLWPPKHSVVKELPRTGFSPQIVRGEGGKRFVWPPPSYHTESGRSTPSGRHYPHSGHSIGNSWHPSESPAMSRTPPFASSPVTVRRCRDDIWPPPSYRRQKELESMTRTDTPLPAKQLHEFDEFVTQHASLAVPPTYHAPPETQHFTYEMLQ